VVKFLGYLLGRASGFTANVSNSQTRKGLEGPRSLRYGATNGAKRNPEKPGFRREAPEMRPHNIKLDIRPFSSMKNPGASSKQACLPVCTPPSNQAGSEFIQEGQPVISVDTRKKELNGKKAPPHTPQSCVERINGFFPLHSAGSMRK
jgi:hypothetical protein